MLEFMKANWFWFVLGLIIILSVVLLIVVMYKKDDDDKTSSANFSVDAKKKTKLSEQNQNESSDFKKRLRKPVVKNSEKVKMSLEIEKSKEALSGTVSVETSDDSVETDVDSTAQNTNSANNENKYIVKYDDKNKNWIVIKNGGKRANCRCLTEEEALNIAKELSKK